MPVLNLLNQSNLARLLQAVADVPFRNNLAKTIPSFVDFRLTAAQMDALNATPITLIAAPGAGRGIIVHRVVTEITPGATPFELGVGTLNYKYTNGAGADTATAVPNATVESASQTFYHSVGLAVVPVANAPIVAHTSADVTAGDGFVAGRIYYTVVDFINDLT